MQERRKIRVSQKAVIARIKRKLAHEGKTLHRSRPNQQWSRRDGSINDGGGYWYMVDANNHVCGPNISTIAQLAADMGALKEWEEMSDE